MAAIAKVTTDVLDQERLINVVVRVEDIDGAQGVGEVWWGIASEPRRRAAAPMIAVIDELLAPRAIGCDADAIERLWFDLWDWGYRYADQGIFGMGLSGLDLALWDLKGKKLGAPVASLLGGPIAQAIPAYASFPPLRDPELLIGETERALAAGFTAIKLHELDPELTALLRDTFGAELQIMVDVNGHFDPVEAIAHGRRLSELGVVWFEEPVRPMRDRDAIARVGRAVECDLAGGENEHTLLDFQDLLATGALTYLQPEITKIGGLTAARRVSALAEVANVVLAPHNFRIGPALYASIHWGFTSPATRWFELPWVPEGVAFSYPADLPPLVDGKIEPLTSPGLGC